MPKRTRKTLFAIDGLGNDRLVILDEATGTFVEDVGPLGIRGPEGLAFVREPTNRLDCNGDGGADAGDLVCSNANDTTRQLLTKLHILAGDLDGQNGVEFADFLVLAKNFGQALNRYVEGDIDDDGQVAFSDFLELSTNFGQSRTSGSLLTVPEPSGLTILALTFTATLAYIRSRPVI